MNRAVRVFALLAGSAVVHLAAVACSGSGALAGDEIAVEACPPLTKDGVPPSGTTVSHAYQGKTRDELGRVVVLVEAYVHDQSKDTWSAQTDDNKIVVTQVPAQIQNGLVTVACSGVRATFILPTN